MGELEQVIQNDNATEQLRHLTAKAKSKEFLDLVADTIRTKSENDELYLQDLDEFIDEMTDIFDAQRKRTADISEVNPQQEVMLDNQMSVEEFIERERVKQS